MATAARCPHPPSRLRFDVEGGAPRVACRWCGAGGPADLRIPGWAARWSAEAAAAALESLDAEIAARCAASANDLSPDGADGLDRLRRLLAERAAGLREGELHGPA